MAVIGIRFHHKIPSRHSTRKFHYAVLWARCVKITSLSWARFLKSRQPRFWAQKLSMQLWLKELGSRKASNIHILFVPWSLGVWAFLIIKLKQLASFVRVLQVTVLSDPDGKGHRQRIYFAHQNTMFAQYFKGKASRSQAPLFQLLLARPDTGSTVQQYLSSVKIDYMSY